MNAHGLETSSFSEEREKFKKSFSLASYLKASHGQAVKTLTTHAKNKTIWFEQIITHRIVDFVKKNPDAEPPELVSSTPELLNLF